MADNIVIEIDLDKGDVKGATRAIEKDARKAGARAGAKLGRAFSRNAARAVGGLARSVGKVTAAVGALATAYLGFKSIKAAQVQEDAVNALNSALIISKNASIEASAGFQAFASQLQTVTRFGDEVILQNAALIQSLGDLDAKGLQRATRATADLATALRVDLGTAATLVGKAAAGEVGTFSRYGLSIKKAGSRAETFARALEAIEAKFGGAAQRDVLTYSGSVEQLSNAFGDVLEEIGQIVTENPKVVKAVKTATAQFVTIGSAIDQFGQKTDVFEIATKGFVRFNDSLVRYVIKPLEIAGNIGDLSLKLLDAGVATLISAFAELGSLIADVLGLVGIENKLTKSVQNFADGALVNFENKAMAASRAMTSVGSTPLSDNLTARNNELRNYFNEQNAIVAENNAMMQEKNTQQLDTAKSTADGIKEVYGGVFAGLQSGFGTTEDSVDSLNKKMAEFSRKAGKQLQQGLAKGAGSAFAAFGAAVAKGENALDAFTESMLKTISKQAVALGTNFILQGTAMLFSPIPEHKANAPALIANGAALAAFGGALGATVGAGGSASGGASAAGGGVTSGQDLAQTEELAAPEDVREAKENVALNLTVEGSLVREQELNGYVSELLEEGSSRDATVIPSLRTRTA